MHAPKPNPQNQLNQAHFHTLHFPNPMNTQCKTQSSQSQFTCTNTQTQVFCPQITKPPTTQHPRQHFLQYPHPKITNSQRPMIQNGSKPPKQTLIPILPTKYHLDPNTGTNSNNSHKLITLPKKN